MAVELEWRDDGTTDTVSSPVELDEALDRLEAAARANQPIVVTLYHGDGRSLSVGLGREGIALSLTGPDGLAPFHVSDSGSGEEGDAVSYVSGGVWTEFPRWSLVPPSAARAAIRHFFETGRPSQEVRWRSNPASRV